MFEPKDFFSAEEHSIRSLFTDKDKVFKIPDYQRNFAWTNHELDQFWEDLKNVITGSYDLSTYSLRIAKPHFFGTILLTKADNQYEVTDGQQRLTVTTILLKVLHDVSNRISNVQDRSGISSLITPLIQKNIYGEPFQARLKLDSTVNNFFENYILLKNTISERADYLRLHPITISNSATQRLKNAHDFFESKMKEEFPLDISQGELIEKLKCFINSFTRFFVVLQLTVNQSDTAYKIFGTINNRGRDLTDSDIIKNELFMSVPNEKRDQVKEQWDSIIETVESEDLTEYLRFQYASSIGPVKLVNLYDAITGHLQKNDPINYLEDLAVESEWFARINLIGGDFWSGNIKEKLNVIKNNLDISHSIPLLLTGAVLYNQDLKSFERLVNATVVFCFRYFTIGKNSVSNLEREIGFMSRSLRNIERETSIKDIDSLIDYMHKLTDDSTFERRFREFSTKSSPLAYYILSELEKSYVKGVVPVPHGLEQHVEHVMPKKPSRANNRSHEWGHVRNLPEYKEYVYKLGNLLILESSINQNVGNSIFDTKKQQYKKSSLHYPKQVAFEKNWDFTTIEERQKQMAKRAVQVWNYT